MNPLPLLKFWREGLIALLVLGVVVQEVRVRGAQTEVATQKTAVAKLQGDVKVYQAREAEAARAAAVRALHNLKNQERTDEEYRAARDRARAVVVRVDKATPIQPGRPDPLAGGGDESTWCFDRGELLEALTGVFQRSADRLNAIVAGLSERDGARSTGDARAGEEVAAAYRSVRAFLLNLEGAKLPTAPPPAAR